MGFPDNILDKILEELQGAKISYIVHFLDREPIIRDFKNINRYNIVLKEAKEHIDNKDKVSLIIQKIDDATSEELTGLLEVINEYFDKQGISHR